MWCTKSNIVTIWPFMENNLLTSVPEHPKTVCWRPQTFHILVKQSFLTPLRLRGRLNMAATFLHILPLERQVCVPTPWLGWAP